MEGWPDKESVVGRYLLNQNCRLSTLSESLKQGLLWVKGKYVLCPIYEVFIARVSVSSYSLLINPQLPRVPSKLYGANATVIFVFVLYCIAVVCAQ